MNRTGFHARNEALLTQHFASIMPVGSLVSLEDHFVSSVCQQDEVAKTLAVHQFPGPILERVIEVGPQRIAVMDEGQVRLQVISHVPVTLDLASCKKTNDELYQYCEQHPSRFAGFATLPMGDPAVIVAELERCVRELGFVGALIPNHSNGAYYDGPDYLPMWRAAEKLEVPIYLHPCPPSSQQLPLFHGNYSEDVVFALATHAWDWHANCGLHFAKLYAAGLFDRCQDLKIILGHLGELVPFMLGRIERKLALTKDAKSWARSFKDAYAHNVWVTTSGMFDMESFRLVLNTTAIGKIMFSVDYPFESTEQSARFMEEIQQSGLVSEEDFSRIGYKNAEKLLGIQVTT